MLFPAGHRRRNKLAKGHIIDVNYGCNKDNSFIFSESDIGNEVAQHSRGANAFRGFHRTRTGGREGNRHGANRLIRRDLYSGTGCRRKSRLRRKDPFRRRDCRFAEKRRTVTIQNQQGNGTRKVYKALVNNDAVNVFRASCDINGLTIPAHLQNWEKYPLKAKNNNLILIKEKMLWQKKETKTLWESSVDG